VSDYIEKLRGLGLAEKADVTLSYEDGCDVFLMNETEVEDAIRETDVIGQFARVVEEIGGDTHRRVVEELLDAGVLPEPDEPDEDEERDEDEPPTAGETEIREGIEENFFDQEFIESSVKRHDYKRGYCTLTATLTVPLNELLDAEPDLSGWTIEVSAKGVSTRIEG
jgi:hypothetical protein